MRPDATGRRICPAPRVSIAIPVYNGERYLRAAMESVLSQTYADLELIVSDNASTDATAGIALDFAARDPRVKYRYNRYNIGAAANFRACLEVATGEYFRWLGADDYIAPTLVERCVEALDANSAAVLAYTLSQAVDESGEALAMSSGEAIDLDCQDDVAERFRRFRDESDLRHGHRAWPMLYSFGVMRRTDLLATSRMPSYINGDSMVILEMLLRGRFVCVPEALTFFRHHAQSYSVYAGDNKQRQRFFDPRAGVGTRLLGSKRVHLEKGLAVLRAPITLRQKAAILQHMAVWALAKHRRLRESQTQATNALPLGGARGL